MLSDGIVDEQGNRAQGCMQDQAGKWYKFLSGCDKRTYHFTPLRIPPNGVVGAIVNGKVIWSEVSPIAYQKALGSSPLELHDARKSLTTSVYNLKMFYLLAAIIEQYTTSENSGISSKIFKFTSYGKSMSIYTFKISVNDRSLVLKPSLRPRPATYGISGTSNSSKTSSRQPSL